MFFDSNHDVQRPTHSRLHIRNASDAQVVLEAVRQNALQLVTRRLNESERAIYVRPGAVFVWEESDDDLGLKRWTDGRVWSQSRMREPFLFYEEKLEDKRSAREREIRSASISDNSSPNFYRFVDGTQRKPSVADRDRMRRFTPGLVKQAYSAYVTLSPDTRPRKWHLTAYLTYSEVDSLPTIESDQLLSNIIVPPGVYRSGKARTRQLEEGVEISRGNPPDGGPSRGGPRRARSPSRRPQEAPPPHSLLQPMRDDDYPYDAPYSYPGQMPSYPYSHYAAQYPAAYYQQQPHPATQPGYNPATTLQPLRHGEQRHPHDPRLAEDERVIQMLNARHII